MHHGSAADPDYRNGEWGPAYLIQTESSELGVLRLRAGDAMPNHLHWHCDESFITLEGHASLWVEGTRHDLTPENVYRCVPGEMHYLVNDSDEPYRCIFIKSPASPGDTVTVPWTPGEPLPERPAPPA